MPIWKDVESRQYPYLLVRNVAFSENWRVQLWPRIIALQQMAVLGKPLYQYIAITPMSE